MELTRLPTAAGREQRVVEWVHRWVARRNGLHLRSDRFGNLELRLANAGRSRPIYFVAHMDHPAFVADRMLGPRRVLAEFCGHVHAPYFQGARVLAHRIEGEPIRGRVNCPPSGPRHIGGLDNAVTIDLPQSLAADDVAPGNVITWDTGRQRIRNGRLYSPAHDNLAGVTAALCAFDGLRRVRGARCPNVRILLTRCEEIGFVGAIAACSSKTLSHRSRLIVLENSKSFADSPIGGGPIVRVGDRISSFDPDLTYRVTQIADRLGHTRRGFRWQRKLMAGGACEATAFQTFGYATTCICLPLGNYHNMDETRGRIGPEFISLADFHGLVRLLVEIGISLDNTPRGSTLKSRLTEQFKRHRHRL